MLQKNLRELFGQTNTYSSSAGKESACNAGEPGLISGSGRSPGEGIRIPTPVFLGFPGGSADKESACNGGDLGLIPELGRSPGEGKAYAIQYFGLENWGHKVSYLFLIRNLAFYSY